MASPQTVARPLLFIKPQPVKARLQAAAAHRSALRLVDHIQVLQQAFPLAVHILEERAQQLRSRIAVSAQRCERARENSRVLHLRVAATFQKATLTRAVSRQLQIEFDASHPVC